MIFSLWIVEGVAVVVCSCQRPETQRREELEALVALSIIPADDDEVFGNVVPWAGEIAVNKIIVAMSVVIWVEHVRPDENLRHRVHLANHLYLFRYAVAEYLSHSHIPIFARFAWPSRSYFVHAQEIFAWSEIFVDELCLLSPDFVELRLRHADRDLSTVHPFPW